MLSGATDWWIVETDELGATACPGRIFAYQAAEVCRGRPNNLHVKKVRPAVPGSVMDDLAIAQSKREIQEVTMNQLQISGALNESHRVRRNPGRVYLVPKASRA